MTRQLEIDQVLRSWLSDGAEHAPERHLLAALHQIEATPQRRPGRLPRLADQPGERPSVLRAVAVGVAMALMLVVLGVGLGIQVGLIRLPDPRPAPEPDGTGAYVLFSNPGDGYQVLLPDAWEAVDVPRLDGEPAIGVRRFGSALDHGYGALTISIGEADGTVRVCELEVSCLEAAGQTSVRELEQTLHSSPREAHWAEVHGDTQLGGEPARFERPNTGGIIWAGYVAFHHVYTLHHGRPVVLSFDYWSIQNELIDPETVDYIVDSFRFIDPPSERGADRPLVQYSNVDDGYQLSLPDDWEVTLPVRNGDPVPGVRRFGSGVHAVGALMISIGDANGSIRLCAPFCIEAVGLTSLDDLYEALRTPELAGPPIESPYGPISRTTMWMVVRGATTLGGEPAGFVRPDNRGGPSSDSEYHHVYAFHEGRPVVISFEYGSVRFGRISERTLTQILESFQFTD